MIWLTKSIASGKLAMSSTSSRELKAWDPDAHPGPVFEPGCAPGLRTRVEAVNADVAGVGPWTTAQLRLLAVATDAQGAQSEAGADKQDHSRRWVLAKRAAQAWADTKSSQAADTMLARLEEEDKQKLPWRGRQSSYARLSAVLALPDP